MNMPEDEPDDADIDRQVSSSIDDAVTAINSAVEIQQQDPGNATDPNDQAVMQGLLGVQSSLHDVAQSQKADMGEGG